MAGQDDTEQRDIDPTQRRLRDLRREGQVPRSKDFETTVGFLFVIGYIIIFFNDISERLQALVMLADPAKMLTLSDGFASIFPTALGLMATIIGPIFAVLVAGILLGAVLDGQGFPINSKAISLDINHINPVEGVKRIFHLRNLVELLKGLAVMSVLLIANSILFLFYLNDVLWAPSCDESCVFVVVIFVLGGCIAIGIILLLIIAAIDLPISRALFKRDNKMTKTELKREQREEFGDPAVRSERKRIMRQMAQTAGYVGMDKTIILLVFGDAAVGLVFKQGETPAPIISARTRQNAAIFVREAALRKIPVVQEPALVAELMVGAAVGDYIPTATFNEVARVLMQNGVAKV